MVSLAFENETKDYSGPSREGKVPDIIPAQNQSLEEINQKLDLLLMAQGISYNGGSTSENES